MGIGLGRVTASRVWLAVLLFSIGWPLGSQTAPRSSAPSAQSPTNSPPASANSGEYTISANVDLVLLDVSVRDTHGGFVSGLTKDSFAVYEDGKQQPITQFASQDAPVTMGLVVDNSGSMRPKKPDVVTAALVLISSSNPQDEVFVVNFNDQVRRGLPDIVPFTDDLGMLRQALAKTDPVGRTALYDAILAALHQLDMGRRDKKTIVLLSDGGDNISAHNFKETMDAVLESRATVYTVGLFNEEDRDRNPDVLRKLANVSGGVTYLPKELSEVQDICRRIAKDIRARYTVGYIPQNLDKTGLRHIKVEAHAQDHGKLVARTRTSYLVRSQDHSAKLSK